MVRCGAGGLGRARVLLEPCSTDRRQIVSGQSGRTRQNLSVTQPNDQVQRARATALDDRNICGARAPLKPLVGRRPQPPCLPTIDRKPKASARAASAAAARAATPCSKPSSFACTLPNRATRLQRRPSRKRCPAYTLLPPFND